MKKLLLITNILSLNTNDNIPMLNTIHVKYYEPLSPDQIINELNIPIKYRQYEFNVLPTFKTIGIKKYYLYLLDYSNQLFTYEFNINTIDDIPPTIYGPKEIYITNDKMYEKEIYLSHFYAFDEIDKNVDVYIEDTNYNIEKKNVYYINLYAKDNSNNISEKKLKINVKYNDYSLYQKEKLTLTLLKNKKYYANEIIHNLQKSMQLEKVIFSKVNIIDNKNNYVFYSETGTYKLSLEIIYENKMEILEIEINVIDNKDEKNNYLFYFLKLLLEKIMNIIKGR